MSSSLRLIGIVVLACLGHGCGGGSSGTLTSAPGPVSPPPLTTGPADCTGGTAGEFTCSGVSLRARVPFDQMNGIAGNDIWGWTDSDTGKEFALVGMTDGTAFVDVTDAPNPVFLSGPIADSDNVINLA